MLEVSTTRAAEPAEVLRLLRQASWGARRTLEDVRTALSVAPMHAGAWEDGRLVGFARAVTDGVYRGFIEDVVIDEAVRGRGVGRELVGALLAALDHLEVVALDCPPRLVGFYEGVGLRVSANTRLERVRGDGTGRPD